MPSHNHGGSTGSVGAGGSHSHTTYIYGDTGGNTQRGVQSATGYLKNQLSTNSVNGMPAHSHTITSQGSGAAMSLMQPYLVVYMWKRTA